ncbi:hypothetical protein HK405_014537 [Cladochytrium tenue]|nr:hypothetical protein HK405_014537 [Cladochytrium tenue]
MASNSDSDAAAAAAAAAAVTGAAVRPLILLQGTLVIVNDSHHRKRSSRFSHKQRGGGGDGAVSDGDGASSVSAGTGGGSRSNERFAMLVAPTSMRDVHEVFEELLDMSPQDVVTANGAVGLSGRSGANAAAAPGSSLRASRRRSTAAASAEATEAMLKCLGQITKAAVQREYLHFVSGFDVHKPEPRKAHSPITPTGSPLLIIMAHRFRAETCEYIHFPDVANILDEVALQQPCYFTLQMISPTKKSSAFSSSTSSLSSAAATATPGKDDLRFRVHTSYEYTDWIAALKASFEVGKEARREMEGTMGPKAGLVAARTRLLDLWNDSSVAASRA